MAGNHPVHVHPPRPLYRFAATALGASMWFFVRITKFLRCHVIQLLTMLPLPGFTVDVPSQAGWPCIAGLEAPVGPLMGYDCTRIVPVQLYANNRSAGDLFTAILYIYAIDLSPSYGTLLQNDRGIDNVRFHNIKCGKQNDCSFAGGKILH